MTLHPPERDTPSPTHIARDDAGSEDTVTVGDRERGRTTVTEQAIEHIATRLIAECSPAGGTGRRLLGITLGSDSSQQDARVRARLHAQTATSLAVRCSVPYPVPVAEVTETVRTQLRRRVAELTGLTVQRVDITVTTLTNETRERVQ